MAPRRARSYHHGDLRRALVEASLSIIEADGLDALSLRKAAKAAGVSHAAPAHHFGDLRGLLAAVAEEGHRRLLTAMQTAAAEQAYVEPIERLRRVGLAFVRFATTHRPHFRAMFHPALSDKSDLPGLRSASDATFEIVVEAVGASQAAGQVRLGDPRALALLAWSALHGLAVLLVDDQLRGKGFAADADTLAGQITADVYLGLRPDADSARKT